MRVLMVIQKPTFHISGGRSQALNASAGSPIQKVAPQDHSHRNARQAEGNEQRADGEGIHARL